jgi:NADH:ubiquinone oxidoreductase subunit F (NADH-binding)
MSDRRGEPRNMPPKLETNGLQDLPTLVSNVETYAWVPYICLHSGKAYAEQGVNGWKGRRIFSVSGDVKRPGVYEVPMGLTLRELIYGEKYCRGIVADKKLKGFAPSGPSGGFLPARLKAGNGLPRDHTENKSWQALATRRGFDPAAAELDILDLELELNLFRRSVPRRRWGGTYVYGRRPATWLKKPLNSVEFFRNESCGKVCALPPGLAKAGFAGVTLTRRKNWSGQTGRLRSCFNQGDGQSNRVSVDLWPGRSVPVPLTTTAAFFAEDVAQHLSETARPRQESG